MKKQQSPNKAREILWLALAFLSFLTAIHKTYYHDFRSSIQFWIFIFIALGIYYLRRRLRQKEDNKTK